MKDIMVDIETLGTKPGCVILSIGAVQFNPFSDELGQEFYNNINADDAERKGFFKDARTVDWWSKQSPESRAHLLPNQLPIEEALKNFTK